MPQITNIADLITFADDIQSTSGERWWFRGLPDSSYKLEPRVYRRCNEEQERNLTNEFRARAATRHHSTPAYGDCPGWLSLMQHYGLPTRLLDWTFSPLIAAFFSVEDPEDSTRDACIWALRPGYLNDSYGYGRYLLPLNAKPLRDLLVPAFTDNVSPRKIAAAMAVESDPRMQMQQGAFTVHGHRLPLCEHPESTSWLQKAVVPRGSVAQIKYELKVLSIRRDSVFPDLSSLARQVMNDVGVG